MKNFLIAILIIVFSTQGMAVAAGMSLMDSKTSISASKQVEKFASINEITETRVTSVIDRAEVLPDIEEMSDYIPLFAISELNSDDAISSVANIFRFISISLPQTQPPPRS